MTKVTNLRTAVTQSGRTTKYGPRSTLLYLPTNHSLHFMYADTGFRACDLQARNYDISVPTTPLTLPILVPYHGSFNHSTSSNIQTMRGSNLTQKLQGKSFYSYFDRRLVANEHLFLIRVISTDSVSRCFPLLQMTSFHSCSLLQYTSTPKHGQPRGLSFPGQERIL